MRQLKFKSYRIFKRNQCQFTNDYESSYYNKNMGFMGSDANLLG